MVVKVRANTFLKKSGTPHLIRIKASNTMTTHHKEDLVHHQKDCNLDSARGSKISDSTALVSSGMTNLTYSLFPLA